MRRASLFLYAGAGIRRRDNSLCARRTMRRHARLSEEVGMGLETLNMIAITVIAVVALFLFSKLGKGGR